MKTISLRISDIQHTKLSELAEKDSTNISEVLRQQILVGLDKNENTQQWTMLNEQVSKQGAALEMLLKYQKAIYEWIQKTSAASQGGAK